MVCGIFGRIWFPKIFMKHDIASFDQDVCRHSHETETVL